MSLLGDIIDVGKSIFRNASQIDDKVSKVNRKSFARGANEQTVQFPAIISDSIPIDMATTITRNLDRVYASFVQIYLSANGVIDLNYIRNPRQFLSQYQSHFKLESVEDYTDDELALIESVKNRYKDFYNGEPRLYLTEDEEKGFMFTVAESVSDSLMRSMKEGMKESISSYNTGLLEPVMEKKDNWKTKVLDSYMDSIKTNSEKEENKETLNATNNVATPRMQEREIKKLNDMQPYAMDLKLLATKGDTSFSQYITYTIGVKTTLHLGKANSLITNISYVLQNKNAMLNFIRWTSGELSLFKDILFNTKDINFNIASKNDKTGRMIANLKRLKNKKVKVSASGLSRLAPFATLVISQYEYNELLTKFGFDLKNVNYAKKVMDELFLMGLIIADETTQTIDMLLDGNASFQTYSLETLQREVTMNSNKLGSELTKMLGSR